MWQLRSLYNVRCTSVSPHSIVATYCCSMFIGLEVSVWNGVQGSSRGVCLPLWTRRTRGPPITWAALETGVSSPPCASASRWRAPPLYSGRRLCWTGWGYRRRGVDPQSPDVQTLLETPVCERTVPAFKAPFLGKSSVATSRRRWDVAKPAAATVATARQKLYGMAAPGVVAGSLIVFDSACD